MSSNNKNKIKKSKNTKQEIIKKKTIKKIIINEQVFDSDGENKSEVETDHEPKIEFDLVLDQEFIADQELASDQELDKDFEPDVLSDIERKVKNNDNNNDNEVILLPKGKKVSRIVHISDTHISNDDSRKTEYMLVFDRLFEDLKQKNITTDDLIVIVGDTVDCDKFLTPQAIELIKYFFVGLSMFCDIIVLLGNHEQSKGMEDNLLDSLTPIIMNNFLTKNRIHVLLENKMYLYKNICFIATQIQSSKVTPWYRKNNYISAHLYHGIINGSTFENGYDTKGIFSLKDFGKFDWLLLGDIHLHQYLNKAKTAFYPSSTVQNRRSEHPLDHGYMLINIENKKTEFCRIKNDYASYNLIMNKDGKINYDINDLAKYADIKITIQSSNKKHVEKFQSNILKKGIQLTNFIESYQILNHGIDTKIKINNKTQALMDINSSDQLIEIIVNYIKENQKLEESKFEDIKNKLNNIIKNIQTTVDTLKNKNIVFHNLEFNNILVFGENNRIDFNTGSYYVSEVNSSGKSCLIDIMSIALHSKSPRTSIRNEYIRHGQTKASTKICLSVNGNLYKIIRVFKRKTLSSQATESIIFEKDNQILFDLTKENRDNESEDEDQNQDPTEELIEDTDKNKMTKISDRKKIKEIIDKEIISYEDTFLCCIVSQTKKINFLSADNKRDLLLKYSGLSIFSNICEYAAKKCGEMTRQLTILYNDKCFNQYRSKIKKTRDSAAFKDTEICNMKNKIEKEKESHDCFLIKNQKIFTKLEKEFNDLNDSLIRLNERIKGYGTQLIEFDQLDDINKIDEEMDALENKKCQYEIELQNINKLILTTNHSINQCKKTFKGSLVLKDEKDKFDQEKSKLIQLLNEQINEQMTNIKQCSIKKKKGIDYSTELNKTINQLKKVRDEFADNQNIINQLNETISLSNDDENILNNYKIYIILENNLLIEKEKLSLYKEFEQYYKELKMIHTFDDVKINEVEQKICKFNKKINSMQDKLNNMKIHKINYEKYVKITDIKQQVIKLKESNLLKIQQLEQINKFENMITDLENFIHNININNEIQKLKDKLILTQQSSFIKYDRFQEIKDQLQNLEKQSNDLDIKSNRLKINISKVMIDLEKKKILSDTIRVNKVIYERYIKDKKESLDLNDTFSILQKKYLNKKKDIEQLNQKDKEYYANYKISMTNYDKYIQIKGDKDSYMIINNMLMNNGLIDSILRDKILIKLEKTTNNILHSINYLPISIRMLEKKGNKYKNNEVLITNNDGSVTSGCGYFEKNVLELAIRMALSQINSFIKINSIFIDEGFDGSSKNNYNKISRLIEHFKDYYPFNLVVSHDDKLVKMFDNRIKIIKPNNLQEIKTLGYKIEQ